MCRCRYPIPVPDDISRRRVLAVVGSAGALAGCGAPSEEGTSSPEATATPTSTETRTPTATSTARPDADVEITSVSLQPDPVTVGDSIEVEVGARNTGGAAGTADLSLGLDDEEVTSERVEIPAGEEVRTVLTSPETSRTGAVTVSLNGQPIDSVTVEGPEVLHVAPDGDDTAPGIEGAPLASVQEGLRRAAPGETVRLHPGEYREVVRTIRDGTSDEPITLTGPPEAVLRPPAQSGDCLVVHHSHFHVTGITIDGLLEPDRKFADSTAWADRCVLVTPTPRYEQGIDYLRDVVIEPSRIGNSGRALIQTMRLRDASIGDFELIGPAGMHYDQRVANHEEGHIGEIVYIGNSETARGTSYHPWETLDRSRDIRIHHIDNSEGYRNAEFVDIKLGSTNITVEYCTNRNSGHSSEPASWPAVNLGGNECTIRWNDFADGPVGVNFAAWVPTGDIDGTEWARNHEVYGNRFADFPETVFNFDSSGDVVGSSPDAQAILCGNEIEGSNAEAYAYASESCDVAVPEGDGRGHLGGDSS
jgi:hypothetical protein